MIGFFQNLLGKPKLSDQQLELIAYKKDLDLHYNLMLDCSLYSVNQNIDLAESIKQTLIENDLNCYHVNSLIFKVEDNKLTFKNLIK